MYNLAANGPTQSSTNSTTCASVPQPRLVKAAHEFEAQMMKELMAPLQAGKDILSGGDEESGSASALGSYAAEALGKGISEHGGFGIATSILHQLSGNATMKANSKHLGKLDVTGIPNLKP